MTSKVWFTIFAFVLSFALLNAAEDTKDEAKSPPASKSSVDNRAEGTEQRVLVYEKGSKPSEAAAKGHYESRKITADRRAACKCCMKEPAAKKEGSKPTANIEGEKECVAYLCCGKLVWHEEGKEVKKETLSEDEVQAVVKITLELSNSKSSIDNRTDR